MKFSFFSSPDLRIRPSSLLLYLSKMKLKRYGKTIFFDTLALLCLLGFIPVSFIPGPGGLPLLIAGLALLGINHEWARRWLETTKHKGVTFKKYLFPNNAWVKAFYDLCTILLVSGGIYVAFLNFNRYFRGVGAMMFCIGLTIFFFNRDRLDTFSQRYLGFKRKHL